jgi:hypothetical protein
LLGRSHSVNTTTPFEAGSGALFAPTFFNDNTVLASNRYDLVLKVLDSSELCSNGSVSMYTQDWNALV